MVKVYNSISEMKDLIGTGKMTAKIYYTDGTSEKRRIYVEGEHTLFIYEKGRKRWGWRISKFASKNIKQIEIKFGVKKTPAQKYVDGLLKIKRYIEKNRHPNVWPSLQKEYESFTAKDIQNFLNDKSITSGYEAWEKAPEYNLPRYEQYKTLSLRSCGIPEDYLARIKEDLDKREKFSYFWRNGYDYSVSGEIGPDGEYRGFLSQEYQGMGNGHYYILINYNHSLFVEDD